MSPINTGQVALVRGENKDILPLLPDNSFDTIITDPPYGLKFMGKKWDYDVPSVETWVEVLRVLKPGGTALVFAGSRTQHRMAVNMEDAGFILKDCIMWLYGSGFPKATDISKQMDKQAGKQGNVIGEKKLWGHNAGSGAGSFSKNQYEGQTGITRIEPVLAPATHEAKLWNGWKSHGLKPAYEPIIVAMKPNEGSYAENALKWGVAGLNIDGGRVAIDSIIDKHQIRTMHRSQKLGVNGWGMNQKSADNPQVVSEQGRFPANIILDEVSAEMLDEQTGDLQKSKGAYVRKNGESQFLGQMGSGWIDKPNGICDFGGASRFFYCAKASRSERNEGCEGLEEKKMGRNQSSLDGGLMLTGSGNVRSNSKVNHHPTVKPLALMEYLCKLTKTPTGGLVLDPYAGSGTTGLACLNTGRECIMIEREAEFWPIIENRCGIKEALHA